MNQRVLVAGLDARDDVVLAEARRRRDLGQEVVLAGTALDPRQVAHVARAEDVRRVVVLTRGAVEPQRARLVAELRAVEVTDAELELRSADT